MGSASSKAARTATGAARRQYPLRPSPSTRETQQAAQSAVRQEDLGLREGDQARAQAQARQGLRGESPSEERNQAINLDGRDPQLANALRQLGPVQPNPTYSPSSSAFSIDPTTSRSGKDSSPLAHSNPALNIMAARRRLEGEFEEDKVAMGKEGFAGKRQVDIHTIKKALVLRDEQGVTPLEVERILGLRKGAVNALGGVGVLEAA